MHAKEQELALLNGELNKVNNKIEEAYKKLEEINQTINNRESQLDELNSLVDGWGQEIDSQSARIRGVFKENMIDYHEYHNQPQKVAHVEPAKVENIVKTSDSHSQYL